MVTDPFICPDDGGTPGCTINKSLVDNNVCDCPGTCADETNYTCDNCSGAETATPIAIALPAIHILNVGGSVDQPGHKDSAPANKIL